MRSASPNLDPATLTRILAPASNTGRSSYLAADTVGHRQRRVGGLERSMDDLDIVTTADRPDLDDQAKEALRTVWPEFIFHDPVSSGHIGRVEAYFPQYDVLVLDDGKVVAGGWGVPIRWDGTISTLPDGYDGALVSAVTGHENSVPADTLCIMAAAVKADQQGGGLAGKTLTALRERATAAGLKRVIAPVRPALKAGTHSHPWTTSPAGPERRLAHRPLDSHTPAAWRQHPRSRASLHDHRRRRG